MDITLGNYLMTVLRTTEIEAMLDTIPNTTYKAIIQGRSIPTSLQDLSNLIQVYRVSSILPDDINEPVYTVNCRQSTESNAETLAGLVYNELNRSLGTYSGDTVYARVTIAPSIFEEENYWNVPVDIRLLSRR
jgi:hypothetical protein